MAPDRGEQTRTPEEESGAEIARFFRQEFPVGEFRDAHQGAGRGAPQEATVPVVLSRPSQKGGARETGGSGSSPGGVVAGVLHGPPAL